MGTTTISFQAGSYKTVNSLVLGFQALILPSTGTVFEKAEIYQRIKDIYQPNFAALTLYSKNGFIIKVNGLHCGRKGEAIIELLKLCNFELDDATIYSILNYVEIKMTLWNKENI